ncbi:MAG: hypothetical protein ACRDK3_02475 [Actinomycetota bacterium]
MNGFSCPRHDPADRLWPPHDPEDFIDLAEWEQLIDRDTERYDRHLQDNLTTPPIREVILAEETEFGREVDIGTWFECTPWDDPLQLPHRISHTRILHRDKRHFRPERLVESWVPAGLVRADVLKEQDCEDALLGLLARKCGVKVSRSVGESIALREPDEDIRLLMELRRGAPLFFVWRIYDDEDFEPLLMQQLAIRTGWVFSHDRELERP